MSAPGTMETQVLKQFAVLKAPLAILSCLICLLSCSTGSGMVGTEATAQEHPDIPQILFLNYSIYKTEATGDCQVRLNEKIQTSGSIKTSGKPGEDPKPGDLVCLELDQDSRVLERTYIRNPLQGSMEYVTEEGQLAIKEMELDSARFNVRLQLQPGARYIAMEEYLGEGIKRRPLLLTKL